MVITIQPSDAPCIDIANGIYKIPVTNGARPLRLDEIQRHVNNLYANAYYNRNITFVVPPIESELPQFAAKNAPLLFVECSELDNVVLPKHYQTVIHEYRGNK